MQHSNSSPAITTRVKGLPASPYDGKTPTPLRVQRLADGPSDRLSPRRTDFDPERPRSRSGSRSVSPQPPDVPRSIESGTDTETDNGNDSDDIMQSYMDRGDTKPNVKLPLRPLPVPKTSAVSSPTEGRIVESQPNSAGVDGDDTYNQEDHGVSAVTTRQSGFFSTPALPPIRFSMNDTDFNDLLSNMGNGPRLSLIGMRDLQKGSTPDKSEDLASVATPTSVASTITPFKEAKLSASATAPPSFKLPERKASLRVKRVPPPALAAMPDDEEKYNSFADPSRIASPLSPWRNETHLRRPSATDAAIKVFDETGSSRSPRSSSDSKRNVNGHSHSRSESLTKKQDSAELVIRRLKEALSDASDRSADYIKLDRGFVEIILSSLEQKKDQMVEMSAKLDKMKVGGPF